MRWGSCHSCQRHLKACRMHDATLELKCGQKYMSQQSSITVLQNTKWTCFHAWRGMAEQQCTNAESQIPVLHLKVSHLVSSRAVFGADQCRAYICIPLVALATYNMLLSSSDTRKICKQVKAGLSLPQKWLISPCLVNRECGMWLVLPRETKFKCCGRTVGSLRLRISCEVCQQIDDLEWMSSFFWAITNCPQNSINWDLLRKQTEWLPRFSNSIHGVWASGARKLYKPIHVGFEWSRL